MLKQPYVFAARGREELRRAIIISVALAGLALAVITGYRLVVPRLFVSARRAPLDAGAVGVTQIIISRYATDYGDRALDAGPGHRYVQVDCLVGIPVSEVDFNDFQLVKNVAKELGSQENVGYEGDRDSFLWAFVDSKGHPVTAIPNGTTPFTVRFSFKVPKGVREAYLFYRGLYWGPLHIE